jgi:cell division protein FtsX
MDPQTLQYGVTGALGILCLCFIGIVLKYRGINHACLTTLKSVFLWPISCGRIGVMVVIACVIIGTVAGAFITSDVISLFTVNCLMIILGLYTASVVLGLALTIVLG